MSNVRIRGMKMPKKCSECLFYVEGASYCQGHRDYETGMETRRMEFCRLIEAPDLQEWQWILLKEVFENVPVITTAARHKENLMEHEIMSMPIGAEAAGVQKQTIEKARTKIIDAAPLMERLKAAIAFGNEKGLPTDELEQMLADIEGMEALPPAQPEIPDDARDAFMNLVYDELHSDRDNNRANRIIDAANEYVEYSLAKQYAHPDNQVHLCDSCSYTYPECPSAHTDMIFGNGIGNDNVCACSKYLPPTQPEPCEDAVSREAVKEQMLKYGFLAPDMTVTEFVEDCLPTIQPEQRWIPVSEGMPEEREWIGTKRFGTTISDEVYVTFETPKGERFCKHIRFQNGMLNSADQHTIDTIYKGSKPIAWMPLPEPWEGDAE